jgi:hypothetical protein
LLKQAVHYSEASNTPFVCTIRHAHVLLVFIKRQRLVAGDYALATAVDDRRMQGATWVSIDGLLASGNGHESMEKYNNVG